MKKTIFFFALLMPILSFSQITFENGYFIDNSDNKTECLIKNIDWRNNPVSFNYKIDETSQIKTGTLEDIKSFEIYNHVKYVRATLKIDRSSNDLNKLSGTRSPEFVEETLFLEQLVDGDANLYKYVSGNLVRYFFQLGNKNIEQLIHKPYQVEATIMAYNEEYKHQLETALACASINSEKIKTTAYKEKDLTNLFLKYNKCANPDFEFKSKKAKDVLNLSLRPRMNFGSLVLANSNSRSRFEMENKISLGLGAEAEYVLPFNKNKWSFVIEPTYQYYKARKTTDVNNLVGGKLITTVVYNSIELPLGLRHHMYLNAQSKIFVNLQYVIDLNVHSSIDFKRSDNATFNSIHVRSAPNLAMGVGYSYNDKYGVEFRFFNNRGITADYYYWLSKYQNMSLILSYNLLKTSPKIRG
ncbi:MAG TPA: autotransporter outer membrane beta-barrel domain-containing protein [Hanamia sp.]|nr:autotransporter outer membrane beta-barrel domain-containing protein [Hanamia sp.]